MMSNISLELIDFLVEFEKIRDTNLDNLQKDFKITKLIKDKFFNVIYKSLISGEYLTQKNYLDLLIEVKSKFNNKRLFVTRDFFEEVNTQKDLNEEFSNFLFNIIEELFKFYNHLLKFDVKNNNHSLIFIENFSISKFKNYNKFEDFNKQINFFGICLNLCYIEYTQLFKIESYLKLKESLSILPDLYQDISIDKKLVEIVEDKINIIKYAIVINYEKNIFHQITNFNTDYNIEFHFEIFRILKSYIDYFNKKTASTYFSDNFKLDFYGSKYLQIFNANKSKELNQLIDLKFDNIILKKEIENNDSLYFNYHEYIFNTNCQYINNCILSTKVKLDNIDSKFDLLENKDWNDNNYYSITKRIDALHLYFQKNKDILKSSELNEILNSLKQNQQNLNIIRNFIHNSLVPYKLPSDECIFKIDNYEVLLLNTYIKYYTPEHIREEIDKSINLANELIMKANLYIEMENHKIQISDLFESNSNKLRNMFGDLKNQNELIQDSLKKSERKSIEIISVFAAIVTFAAASLNTLPKMEDVDNIIASTTLFGLVLVLFIYLLLYILDPKRNPQISDKSLKNIFFAVLISGITLNFIYLISHSNFYILIKLYHLFY